MFFYENNILNYECITGFAHPKSAEEVNNICTTAVPKKTKADTEYCMRIWDAWWKERIARDESEAD